jgi:hypothetical protein
VVYSAETGDLQKNKNKNKDKLMKVGTEISPVDLAIG